MSTGNSKLEPKTKVVWIIKNCLEYSMRSHQKWVDYLKGDIEPEVRKNQEELVGNVAFHENCIQRYEMALQALGQLQAENERLKAEKKELGKMHNTYVKRVIKMMKEQGFEINYEGGATVFD